MRVLVTGADGFVGRSLSDALSAQLREGDDLVVTDICAPRAPKANSGKVSIACGDLADREFSQALCARGFDRIYHLATVPGRASELNFSEGKRCNLDGTLELLEGVRQHCPRARLVYASSAAIFGMHLSGRVDDSTPINPCLSYAAHKAVCEILINDYTRRGYVDGISLRLSGILARPGESAGNASAFLHMIHAARRKQPFAAPMHPASATWLMSVRKCVLNLLHAGSISEELLPGRRNWTLPALRVSMADFMAGLSRKFGYDVASVFTYAPDAGIEAIFEQPDLDAAIALRLGFSADRSIDALLADAEVH
jgi:D-erythronate 2-dehydrogenase